MCPADNIQYRYTLARNGEWESDAVKIVTFLAEFTDNLKKSKVSSKCRLATCDGYTPVIKCVDSGDLIFPFVLEIVQSKKLTAPKMHDLVIECLTEAYQPETAIRPTYTGVSFDYTNEAGRTHRVDIAIVQYDGTETRFLRFDARKGRFSFGKEEMSAFDLSEMNTLRQYYKENMKQKVIGEFGRLLCESGEPVDDTLACYDQAARNIMNEMLNDPKFDPNKLAYPDDPENDGPVY